MHWTGLASTSLFADSWLQAMVAVLQTDCAWSDSVIHRLQSKVYTYTALKEVELSIQVHSLLSEVLLCTAVTVKVSTKQGNQNAQSCPIRTLPQKKNGSYHA